MFGDFMAPEGVAKGSVVMMGKTIFAAIGGVVASFTSALCCAGPLLAVTVGISGAGLSARFEPLRPYFLIATAVML